MQEYRELQQLFQQHGQPTDYHMLIEHTDFLALKESLGEKLIVVFLCLLSTNCEVSDTLLDRMVRYKKENRLRDIEQAILKLQERNFTVNSALVHSLCYLAGKSPSFLGAVELLDIAKHAEVFNPATNVIAQEALNWLSEKKITLYKKLIDKSALDRHVLKNTSFSSFSPTTSRYSSGLYSSVSEKMDAIVDIYVYAKLCGLTEQLNDSKTKVDVIALFEVSTSVASTIKKLHEKQYLLPETFFLALKLRQDQSTLFQLLEFIENNHLSMTTVFQFIDQNKAVISCLKNACSVLRRMTQHKLAAMNDDCVISLLALEKMLVPLDKSMEYLACRTCLTSYCFELMRRHYTEKKQRRESDASVQASKKQRSSFFYSFTEEKEQDNTAVVLFALSEARLLQQSSDSCALISNELVLRLLALKNSDFIYQLYELGELHQHSLALALAVDFDKQPLDYLVKIAALHLPIPEEIPQDNVPSYLESLFLLSEISIDIPAYLQTFAFNQPAMLAKVLNHFIVFYRYPYTLKSVTQLVEFCQSSDSQFDSLDQKIVCLLLEWPLESFVNLNLDRKNIDSFLSAFTMLKKIGCHVSPSSDYHFVFPDLYASSDIILDTKIIAALFSAQLLNQQTWHLLSSVNVQAKHVIPVILQRLTQHHQCHLLALTHIFSAKKPLLALELWLLLSDHSLSHQNYWEALLAHAHPLLLCRGLVSLHERHLLTSDYFSKISQTKQPLLAVNALAQILESTVSLEVCWGEISQAENPQECAAMFMGSATPEEINEDLPAELRAAMAQHDKPHLARQHLKRLMQIPQLKTTYMLQVLPLENAAVIIDALVQLEACMPMHDKLVTLVMNNPKTLDSLKEYVSTGNSLDQLLAKLDQTATSNLAELVLERECCIAKYPDQATLLRESMADFSEQKKWVEALMILSEVDEITPMSIEYLQRSSVPNQRAMMMAALKKAGLYSKEYIDIAIARENQQSGVFVALRTLMQQGDLTIDMFKFVMINHSYAVIKAAKYLIDLPGITFSHLHWLASYSDQRFFNPAVVTINKLHEAKLLSRYWIEKMMQLTTEPPLSDVANQLSFIDAKLLDTPILEAMFSNNGICYENDNDDYYNPFEKFHENEPELLTQDVIRLIVQQTYGKSYTVYYNMVDLHKADLFRPEIIQHCTNQDRTQAIITLCLADQWHEKNQAIILASRHPKDDAQLIVCLCKQNKYTQLISELLLSRVELVETNAQRLSSTRSYSSSYFAKQIKDLLEKNPALQEGTIEFLLSQGLDWNKLGNIFSEMKQEDMTDDCIQTIALADLAYLETYIHYISLAFNENCRFSDVLRLCAYEPYLNQESFITSFSEAVSYSTRKAGLDKHSMRLLISDLWRLCEAGDQDAISARILSPTQVSMTMSSVCRP